jgi:hypothetical protein
MILFCVVNILVGVGVMKKDQEVQVQQVQQEHVRDIPLNGMHQRTIKDFLKKRILMYEIKSI